MSDDCRSTEKSGADWLELELERLQYRVPMDSADADWVVQQLTARRASYQAPFATQSFPIMAEVLAQDPMLDPNESFFFGPQTGRPGQGTVTSNATEESDKVAATGQVTGKGVDEKATYDANVAVDKVTAKIELPPGSNMLTVARQIFSTEQVEEVFEPLVADYQYEYFKEMHRGADRRTLAAFDRQYGLRYVWAIVRELGPVIWRVIVAIGVALKIAG